MKHLAVWIALAVLSTLAGIGWATRWQVIFVDQNRQIVYLMNRWTDELRVIDRDEWLAIERRVSRPRRLEEPALSR